MKLLKNINNSWRINIDASELARVLNKSAWQFNIDLLTGKPTLNFWGNNVKTSKGWIFLIYSYNEPIAARLFFDTDLYDRSVWIVVSDVFSKTTLRHQTVVKNALLKNREEWRLMSSKDLKEQYLQ